jgi:N-acetyl-S-(2-succino)cysteine monooxygenase
VAGGRTSSAIIGTASDVADMLAEWYEAGAADGFIISPPALPFGLEDFVDQVVPILQDRGLFREDYEGTTLRDHLELETPNNRYVETPALRSKPEVW